MIACRGSPGSDHSGRSGWSSSASRPSAIEESDERRREALRHRPRREDLVRAVERVVALEDDLTALDDDDRGDPLPGVGLLGCSVDGIVEDGLVDARRQLTLRPVSGRERHAVGLGRVPVGRRRASSRPT